MNTKALAEQAAYDQLDPRLRDFVANFPEPLSCVWLLEQQRRRGAEIMLEDGQRILRQRFPGWKA